MRRLTAFLLPVILFFLFLPYAHSYTVNVAQKGQCIGEGCSSITGPGGEQVGFWCSDSAGDKYCIVKFEVSKDVLKNSVNIDFGSHIESEGKFLGIAIGKYFWNGSEWTQSVLEGRTLINYGLIQTGANFGSLGSWVGHSTPFPVAFKELKYNFSQLGCSGDNYPAFRINVEGTPLICSKNCDDNPIRFRLKNTLQTWDTTEPSSLLFGKSFLVEYNPYYCDWDNPDMKNLSWQNPGIEIYFYTPFPNFVLGNFTPVDYNALSALSLEEYSDEVPVYLFLPPGSPAE
ncbi:MAG TPA: hypothetical protein ENF97_01400, partial [Candidatus Omnitrophica bacterium]|nr:hypothetical protein [Candidatus Omnitrophota bacterium]